MSSNDMILDLDNFDFSLIDSDDSQVVDKEPEYDFNADDDVSVVEDEFVYDDEDSNDDDMDDDGGDDEPSFTNVAEFAEKFEDIPDDVEFVIDGNKVTKADLAQSVRNKVELDEARNGLSTYIQNLSATEAKIQDYIKLSVSETENRLTAINQMLARPESLSPSDLQKAFVAKRDLEARYAALEQNVSGLRQAEAERKEQVAIAKIRQADVALRGTPGYSGMNTIRDIAAFGESNGLSSELLMEGMSPSLIRLLMDAKMYREKVGGGKDRIKAAVSGKKQAPNARSVSSRSSKKPAKGSSNYNRAKNEAMKKYASGDASAIFDYLED